MKTRRFSTLFSITVTAVAGAALWGCAKNDADVAGEAGSASKSTTANGASSGGAARQGSAARSQGSKNRGSSAGVMASKTSEPVKIKEPIKVTDTDDTNVKKGDTNAKKEEHAAGKVEKTPDEWRKELTDQEFYVLRQKGTERAFTGEFWNSKEKGTYTCAGCGQKLFESGTKFNSGTGWPSFFQPIEKGAVGEEKDTSFGMVRIEVVCSRCEGHLGHVFDDGPRPTGLRYCVNSVSLDFEPVRDEEKKPEDE